MSLDEFVEELKQIGDYRSYDSEKRQFKFQKKDKITAKDYLYKEWRTGGVAGGSCWDEGESNHYSVPGEEEPNFDQIDTILELVCPQITFLNYKKLISSLEFIQKEWENYEYYGNSTSYKCKAVKIQNLYDKLKEMKLV